MMNAKQGEALKKERLYCLPTHDHFMQGFRFLLRNRLRLNVGPAVVSIDFEKLHGSIGDL
jgi:hypothetical protein